MAITTTVTLSGVGGKAPYTFQAPAGDPKTSLPNGTYAIVGAQLNQLQIDSTSLSPGAYTVRVVIIDSTTPSPQTADKIITVNVVDPTLFTILNTSQSFSPTTFPSAQSIPLLSSGGTGVVTWTLLPSVTTLPDVTIDNSNNLVFSLAGYGSWTVGVQATDDLKNVTSKVLQIQAVNAQVFQLVDGQVEISVNAPSNKTGFNNFTIGVKDSVNATASTQFSYKVENQISDIRLKEAYFDHVWGPSDTTALVIPILGNLAGFTVNTEGPTQLDNGISYQVDGANNVVKVFGPPSVFQNDETTINLNLLQGSQQVATISREYTFLARSSSTDLGDFTCYTRPYIVEDAVGLNPLKPWFNSPNTQKPTGVTVRMQLGSVLPLGLSLDTNTGLIYGKLLDTSVLTSTLEYVDASGVIHGTVTIVWDLQKNGFSVDDSLTVGQIQQPYTGTIGSLSSVALTTVSTYRGRLPNGITAYIDTVNNEVAFSGSPTEAGYFDVWFKVTNAQGQTAYLYHRLIIDYINPLVILTSSLPTAATNQPYSLVMQGFGGVTPYTWALDPTSPALPTGITLNSAGLISGTPTDPAYDQNLIINLTDARNVTTTAILELKIDNTLAITTVQLPKVIPGQSYSFQVQARGGTGGYTWNLSGTLPSGISFDKSAVGQYGTGIFSGVTSDTGFSQSVTITVKDSSNATAFKVLTLATGTASGMLIDTSGVGAVDRGAPYQGLLRAVGTFTAPNSWQVAPDSPNALPTGLSLNANASDQGVTATISGTTTRVLSGYPVKIIAVDSVGNSAQAFVLLNTTSSLAVATKALSPGTINGSYSLQLQATGYNTPFTWSLDPSSPALPSGYSLSSNGLLSGITGAAYNQNIVVKVTDSLGSAAPDHVADTATATLNLLVQNSTLNITTTTLPQATGGRSYSTTLAATGGVPAYTWSISPNSANQLPSGLALSSAGVISGNTNAAGYSKPMTIRVTDSIGAYVEKTFTLTVISGLDVKTGIDYTDGTSTNYLGYITNGSVDSISAQNRPNYSFYVIATGVVSSVATLQSNITLSPSSGFTATVEQITSGVAYIRISGPFASTGVVGDNNFGVSVTDAGVNVSKTFKYKIYDNGLLAVNASNAFPQRYTT